jgi:glycosyltransferase involved in cell wall biosynthesis
MRVALFSSTVDPKDGYGTIAYELSRHLFGKGIDVTLFLPRSQERVAASLALPFPVRCELPEYIYRIYQPKALGYLRTVDLRGFDLVHSLFEFPLCLVAARSAKKARLPFLMGAQGSHGVRPLTYFPEKYLVKRCYRRARFIVVPSVFTRTMMEQYAGERYRMEIIHNGVNFPRFQKEVGAASLREKHQGKIVLLTVGGLWGRKGHELTLRALQKVVQVRRDVRYVIVGDGNNRERLQALTAELGLNDFVEFAGRKSGDDLVRAFQASDIYVHTPVVTDDLKFEGFGIVYLEASACGKPVVATDAGGIRDAVLEGKTGLIASAGDVDGIADRLLKLCGDPALRQRLGEEGRRYAEQHDWNRIAEQFLNLYHQAAHG